MATEEPTTTAENVRIARRVPEDVATDRDLELIDDLFAEDAVDRSPFGEFRGPAEFRENLEELLAAFPDFSATVEDVVAQDDTVAMRVRLRGTHEGEFIGVDPTGREFDVQNAVFTRVEDGRISERWVLPDMLGMMRQLGAIDEPAA